jgi:hypothetical protein
MFWSVFDYICFNPIKDPTASRRARLLGLGPSYYPASLLWSPGPRPSPVFRSAICDCLSLNVSISLRLCCPPQHRPEPRGPPSARSPACAIAGAAPACTPPCAPSSAPFGTPPRSSVPAPLHAGRDQCGRGRTRRAPRAGAGQRAHLSTLTQAKALLHAAHGARADAVRCSPQARRVFPRCLARRDC